MPRLLFAVSAGEFLDEMLFEEPCGNDCWIEYNPDSIHPYEVWSLF